MRMQNFEALSKNFDDIAIKKPKPVARKKPTVVVRLGAEQSSVGFQGYTFDIRRLDDAAMNGTAKDVCYVAGIK
jgi:hypothetical protein